MNSYKKLESAIKVGQETIDRLRAECSALQERVRELESRLTQRALDGRYCVRCEQLTVENGICPDCDVPETARQ
jgi:predicted nuclease with TOPRIM domain